MRAPRTDAEVNRLLRQKLPVFEGRWLPQLACYLPNDDRPVRKRYFNPVPREPQVRGVNIVKPEGGLWTGPLLATGVNGPDERIVGTSYSMRFFDPAAVVMYEIKARRKARVAVIHTHAHLLEMQRRYPLDFPMGIDPFWDQSLRIFGLQGKSGYVDWHAAAKDFDAVWITSEGIQACDEGNIAVGLWHWSFETVFFLRPAFHVRRRTHRPIGIDTLYPPEDSMFANLIRAARLAILEEEDAHESVNA